jgi:hypothetical protein
MALPVSVGVLEHTGKLGCYEERSEMIFTQLVCSNVIITYTLNTKLLLAQHIPLLRYTSLSSPWALPNGFTEPFYSGAAMPLTDSRLYSFLATVEAPCPANHTAACRCFLSTNCR